eukprot:203776-Chlamydomonas_euryale.AAC.1
MCATPVTCVTPCVTSWLRGRPPLRVASTPVQIGLAEMRECVLMSGGLAVTTDTFYNPTFKVSVGAGGRARERKEGGGGMPGSVSGLEGGPESARKVGGHAR